MRGTTERRGLPVKMRGIIVKTKGTTGRTGKTERIGKTEKTGKMRGITGKRGHPVKMKETTGRMRETTEKIGKTERMRGTTEIIGTILSKYRNTVRNLQTIMSAISFSDVCNIILLAQFSLSTGVGKYRHYVI